jgi:hypothetical protein
VRAKSSNQNECQYGKRSLQHGTIQRQSWVRLTERIPYRWKLTQAGEVERVTGATSGQHSLAMSALVLAAARSANGDAGMSLYEAGSQDGLANLSLHNQGTT